MNIFKIIIFTSASLLVVLITHEFKRHYNTAFLLLSLCSELKLKPGDF